MSDHARLRRQPEAPVDVVHRVLERHGVRISVSAAVAVADAVLSSADARYQQRQMVSRAVWERSAIDMREHLVRNLRRQVMEELAKVGAVPTMWPAEDVRFLQLGTSGTMPGAPPWREVPEHGPWDTVQVTLDVPCRRAQVDAWT